MRVKNKTNKVITIRDVDILPDEVKEIGTRETENPAVKMLLERKYIVAIPDILPDEPEVTPEEVAKSVSSMKKNELIAECEKLGIDYADKTVGELRQLITEKLI